MLADLTRELQDFFWEKTYTYKIKLFLILADGALLKMVISPLLPITFERLAEENNTIDNI